MLYDTTWRTDIFPSFLHFSELIFSSSIKTNAHVSKNGSPAKHRLNVYSEKWLIIATTS